MFTSVVILRLRTSQQQKQQQSTPTADYSINLCT
jgi:hypothetical protein